MTILRALPVLLAVTLLWTSLPGCAQNYPASSVPRANPPQFPFIVRVDTDESPAFRMQIVEAIATWNETVGIRLFRYEEIDIETVIVVGQLQEPDMGTVYIYSAELGMASNGDTILGITDRFHASQFDSSAAIRLDDDIDIDQVYPVVLHELGHVLGLSHDMDEQASIMHPHPLDSSGDIMEGDIVTILFEVYSLYNQD